MNENFTLTIIGLVLLIFCGLFIHLIAIGTGWIELLVIGIAMVSCFVIPYMLFFRNNFMRYLDQIDRRFRR
jgi:hypothetical protein